MSTRHCWLAWEPNAVRKGRREDSCSVSKCRSIPWTILRAASWVGSSLKGRIHQRVNKRKPEGRTKCTISPPLTDDGHCLMNSRDCVPLVLLPGFYACRTSTTGPSSLSHTYILHSRIRALSPVFEHVMEALVPELAVELWPDIRLWLERLKA